MGMNANDEVKKEDPPKKQETKKPEPAPEKPKKDKQESNPNMDGWSNKAPKEKEFENPFNIKPSKEEHDKLVEEMADKIKEIDAKNAEDIKNAEEKANVKIAKHEAKMAKRQENINKAGYVISKLAETGVGIFLILTNCYPINDTYYAPAAEQFKQQEGYNQPIN